MIHQVGSRSEHKIKLLKKIIWIQNPEVNHGLHDAGTVIGKISFGW
jgi:hypothetical protein